MAKRVKLIKRKGKHKVYSQATVNSGKHGIHARVPNATMMAGYVNRGTFIDLERMFSLTGVKHKQGGLTQDIAQDIPTKPKIRAEILRRFKTFLEEVETEAHKYVKIVDNPVYVMWKFHNTKYSRVFFIKLDFERKEFRRSAIYSSNELAQMRFDTGTIRWTEIIRENPSP